VKEAVEEKAGKRGERTKTKGRMEKRGREEITGKGSSFRMITPRRKI